MSRYRSRSAAVAALFAASSLVAVGTAGAAPSDNASDRAHAATSKDHPGKGKGPHGHDHPGKGKGPHGHDHPGKGKGKGPHGHPGKGNGPTVEVQLLSFNDFHGHLEADSDGVGGAAALAGKAEGLRAEVGDKNSITVAAGDLIGASPFASSLFQDEPTIEVLNAMGLDTSAVGNHEFDEGVDELLRIQGGGCFEGECFEEFDPYTGANFPYMAANVEWKDSGEPILPPTHVEKVKGVKVGFIGVVTSDLPILVNPAGIADVNILDEAETINRYAAQLQSQGVESIVAVMHEGGAQEGSDPNGCENLSGPLVPINEDVDPSVDVLVTGHSHAGYVCELTDPAGETRLATQSNNYGNLLTETTLTIDRRTKDVVRDETTAFNHAVTEDGPVDPEVADLVDKWTEAAAPIANGVVGSVAEDITGDASGDRGIETPMTNLVADSILWGTEAAENGGAQVALMNVGGVRDSFLVDEISAGEAPGEITYAEAAAVAPFSNIIVSMDLTGAQLKDVLEQQYDPNRSRPMLALGVSEGFNYAWDSTTNTVVEGSMSLNGESMSMNETYRVATLNFLADGGDGFSGFLEGTNVLGAGDDLDNLVAFLEANPDLTAPEGRVDGL